MHERALAIHTSYVLCTTPRTGSNFLCEVLSGIGVAGNPQEYFWNIPVWQKQWGVSDAGSYLDRIAQEGATPNGVFGIKMMNWHLDECAAMVAETPKRSLPPPLLSAVFPNVHYVWLTRRDRVRQAISLHRAHQTGQWRNTDAEVRSPAREPSFDFELIDLFVDALMLGDAEWQDYFTSAGVRPFTLVYEDFIQDPAQAGLDILHYLRIPVPEQVALAHWQLERQADAISDQWAEQFRELKQSALQKRLP
jgi:LPS sulfotransferase NodH